MKKAKVAISFDDGRKDNVAIIENLLAKNGIPSTLYVTTGYVDQTCPDDKLPTKQPAMSVEDVVRLFHNPLVEIGMHGDMHLNDDWDIRNGRQKLLRWLNLDSSYRFGFASPSTNFSIDYFKQSADPLFTDEIAYLAMGMRKSSMTKFRSLARKGGRVIHSGLLYRMAYQDTLMTSCQDRIIYRVPVHGDITFHQIRAMIEEAIRSSSSLTFMFHSVSDDYHDIWTWSLEKFNRLIAYLKDHEKQGTVELVKVQNIVECFLHSDR